MTLISSFAHEKFYFLLGDLLISGDEPENYRFDLPSIGNVDQVFPTVPNKPGWVPVELSRKLFSFSNVAIGWAGNHILAKTFASELYKYCGDRKIRDIQDLAELLNRADEAAGYPLIEKKLCLIGHLLKPNGIVAKFGSNFERFPSRPLGNIWAAGSGISLLKEHFAEDNVGLYVDSQQNGFSSPSLVAKNVALGISGTLLIREIETFHTLHQYTGGGYEVICTHKGNISPLNKVLYILWDCKVQDKHLALTPHARAFYHEYIGDLLLIRSVAFSLPVRSQIHVPKDLIDESIPIAISEDKTHIIPSVHISLHPSITASIVPPTMDALTLASYIRIRKQEGLSTIASIYFSETGNLPIKFRLDGESPTVTIHSHYINHIFESVRSVDN